MAVLALQGSTSGLVGEARSDIAVSVITEGELRTGAAKSSVPAKTLRAVEHFLQPISILEFTSADAASYAEIRAKLERTGVPIGPLDTLIVAQAVGRRLTLVSNNQREFGCVPGLRLDNWAAAK
jgi:tRNA(fMet)-specific endonuclease VapC